MGNSAVAKVKVPLVAITQPLAPAAVTATIVDQNTCGARKVRYSVPAYPTAATGTIAAGTGYNWSFVGTTLHRGLGTAYVIDSMNVSGLSASSVIVIKYLNNSAAVTTDSVRCAYTTACGTGAIAKVKVPFTTALTGCPAITGNQSITKAPVVNKPSTESMAVKVFPNPSTTNFNVRIIAAGNEEAIVRVLDMQGRFLKSVVIAPNKTINLGSDLKAGTYILEVRQGKEVKTVRVMKF
jgi:hypothetical protein